MQGNGPKIFAVVAFLVVSIWYLWPTFQNYQLERELAALDSTTRAERESDDYEDIQDLRERALKLGLDLQGGMHVTLEVRMSALLTELADNRDETFDAAIAAATERAETEDASYVSLFVDELTERQPDVRLARYFRNQGAGITRRSSNDEVVNYLNTEQSDAIDRAVEIVRQRVDRFGVSEPSIQKQGDRRIIVEMPGVDDPARVRNLLRGTARLEFRLVSDADDVRNALQGVLTYYDQQASNAPADTASVPQDSLTASSAEEAIAEAEDDSVAAARDLIAQGAEPDEAEASGNPLVGIFFPRQDGVSGGGDPADVFGYVAANDTATVRALLQDPAVADQIPGDMQLMYTASPRTQTETGEPLFALLAIRAGRPELTGEVITDARVEYMPATNEPYVSLSMDSEGARRWSRITGSNVNRQVAIVLDGVVYTDPVIRGQISGGRTSIEGVSQAEASDVVTVLKSGALPAPVDIVEERTVGPSLGARSIRDGTRSVLLGLALVAIFMVLYYHTFGLIANLALLLNILFIFGILAAFKATLTLPGIAGIVLTIGMAVDANVLIFDRIREEMTAGKTLKAAVQGGYEKALSAIFDANITTFLTGVILYSFGVGPIQGFAVTLMAGIVSSLFTAIIVTRILVDYLVVGRRAALSIG